ncbi:glycosyltransferase family 2 protein [Pontiella agarivorans]|uniref:Glycosyltransferase n=1 Tax=Pontiella agarivorans TaxID=3038953 RepID=A0ABU5MX44_9BACT|nr:glycosyltransferase [Pontiella agarivorans]MDZ8118708.1 glycosyltransferase [Pontiella agarivorans]
MPPSVAIIMRAKNEMPYVEQALEMLQQQTLRTFDLFAVDSGSTDGSFQALEKSQCSLQQIPPEEYVPGRVLNRAIEKTGHDLIVLLNADAVPQHKDWLEKLIAPILGNEAEVTFSKQVARPDAKFIVRYDYDRAYRKENLNPGFFSAVACAFTRSLWESHPFPEPGYAEDARWAAALIQQGIRIRLQEDSVVEHSHNYSLTGLYQKRYRQALVSCQFPNAGKQALRCLQEIIRDLAYTVFRFRPLTIPYNLIYRLTIHRADYRGQKDAHES